MTCLRHEKNKNMEDNTVKDVRNLFRLRKEIDDTSIKEIIYLFRLKEENEAIKVRVIREIRNHFEHEEEDYCKSVKVGKFWSNNHIEYENNGDRYKTLSIEEYHNKIRPYLKDIDDLKNSYTW